MPHFLQPGKRDHFRGSRSRNRQWNAVETILSIGDQQKGGHDTQTWTVNVVANVREVLLSLAASSQTGPAIVPHNRTAIGRRQDAPPIITQMRADGIVLKVARSGPAPEIELIFGHAQWGKYEVYLWDPAGDNSTLIRRGLNNDQIPDRFALSRSAAELEDRQLTWEATIGAMGDKGQQFSLQVIFTQDGKRLTANPFEYRGPLDAVKVILDFVKFKVL